MTNYDLKDRTLKFSSSCISIARVLPKDIVSRPLISQFIKSATSIGANYCEADNAESRADFKHKIGICRKEAQESSYWSKVLITAIPEYSTKLDPILHESEELNLIFCSIIRKLKEENS